MDQQVYNAKTYKNSTTNFSTSWTGVSPTLYATRYHTSVCFFGKVLYILLEIQYVIIMYINPPVKCKLKCLRLHKSYKLHHCDLLIIRTLCH